MALSTQTIQTELEEEMLQKRLLFKRKALFLISAFLISILCIGIILDYSFLFSDLLRWGIWAFMLSVVILIAIKFWVLPSKRYSSKQAMDDLEQSKNDTQQLLRTAFEIEQKEVIQRNKLENTVLVEAAERIEIGNNSTTHEDKYSRYFRFLKKLSMGLFFLVFVNQSIRTGLIRILIPFSNMHYTTVITYGQNEFFPGEEVQVGAHIKGRRQQYASLFINEEGDNWEELKVNTNRKKNFEVNLEGRKHKFSYYMISGDGKSKIRQVNLIAPPEIDSIWTTISYPAYMQKKNSTQKDGSIKAYEGSQINLYVRISQTMHEAFIQLPNQQKEMMEVRGNLLHYRFQMPDTIAGEYTIYGLDKQQTMLPKHSFKIQSLQDKLPSIRILNPSKDIEVTALTELPVTIYAYDDIGLSEIGLVVKVDGEETEFAHFSFTDSIQLDCTQLDKLMLEKLDVSIQSNIRFYAWVKDRNPNTKKRGVSILRGIDIRPYRKLYALPQKSPSSSMSMESKQEEALMKLEEMIQIQRNVLSKTFKIVEEGESSDQSVKLSETEQTLSNQALVISKKIGGENDQAKNMRLASESLEQASTQLIEEQWKQAFENEDQALTYLTRLRNNLLKSLKKSNCKSCCKNSSDKLTELAIDVDKLIAQENEILEKYSLFLLNTAESNYYFQASSLQNKTLIDAAELKSMLDIHPDGTPLNMTRMEEAIDVMKIANGQIENQRDARVEIEETILRLEELAEHLRGLDQETASETIKKAKEVVQKTALKLKQQAKDKKTIGRKDKSDSKPKKDGKKDGEKKGNKPQYKNPGSESGSNPGGTKQALRDMEMSQDWLNALSKRELPENNKNSERFEKLMEQAQLDQLMEEMKDIEERPTPLELEQMARKLNVLSQLLEKEEMNLTMSKLDRLATAKKLALSLKSESKSSSGSPLELIEMLGMFNDYSLTEDAENMKGKGAGDLDGDIDNVVSRINELIDELLKDEVTNASDIRVPSKYKSMVEEYFKSLSDDFGEESEK